MFRKGDTVVHPEHGAAVIEELREKEFLGEKRTYLVLRVAYGDLTLMIPTDSTEQVGLRSVVSKAEVKKVLKVLTEDESSMAAPAAARRAIRPHELHRRRMARIYGKYLAVLEPLLSTGPKSIRKAEELLRRAGLPESELTGGSSDPIPLAM